MIYQAEFETPAGTAQASPYETIVAVTKGLVYRVVIYAPHGAMGHHYVQVFDGSLQLWPSSPGRSFRGDGFIFDFEDLYLKDTPPFHFTIKSWNLDDTYPHLCWIYIGMVSKEEFIGRFLPTMQKEQANNFIEDLKKQQEQRFKEIIAEGFSFVPVE